MPTSVLVRWADRPEGFLRQVQVVILTIELIGSVFLEEVPDKIFGPFRRDQPIILKVSIHLNKSSDMFSVVW